MIKTYGLKFTAEDPRDTTGLSPTLLTFASIDGTSVAVPGITEPISGSGLYTFDATLLTTNPIYFLCDGTASAPTATRFVSGILDPVNSVDIQLTQHGTTTAAESVTLTAIGTTNAAINTTLAAIGTTNAAIGLTVNQTVLNLDSKIGSTASAFGDNVTDPVDIYGYLKRALEFKEGDATFDKGTGVWTVQDRTGATTIASKTLANTVDEVTKS